MKTNPTLGREKSSRLLIRHLRRLRVGGTLEPAQLEAAVKAIRRIDRGLARRDSKEVAKAVSDLVRVFLKDKDPGDSEQS